MLSNASTNALKVSAGIVISLWSLSLTVARLILRPDLRLSDEGRAFSRLTTTKSSCSKAAPRTTRRFYHLLTCLLHPSYACLHRLSEVEHDELRKLGIDAQAIAVSRPIAVVLGIHFRGNEWGKTRCGSVIVTSCRVKIVTVSLTASSPCCRTTLHVFDGGLLRLLIRMHLIRS